MSRDNVVDLDRARDAHPDFLSDDVLQEIHRRVLADLAPTQEDMEQAIRVYQQTTAVAAALGRANDLIIALSVCLVDGEQVAAAWDEVAHRAGQVARFLRQPGGAA